MHLHLYNSIISCTLLFFWIDSEPNSSTVWYTELYLQNGHNNEKSHWLVKKFMTLDEIYHELQEIFWFMGSYPFTIFLIPSWHKSSTFLPEARQAVWTNILSHFLGVHKLCGLGLGLLYTGGTKSFSMSGASICMMRLEDTFSSNFTIHVAKTFRAFQTVKCNVFENRRWIWEYVHKRTIVYICNDMTHGRTLKMHLDVQAHISILTTMWKFLCSGIWTMCHIKRISLYLNFSQLLFKTSHKMWSEDIALPPTCALAHCSHTNVFMCVCICV